MNNPLQITCICPPSNSKLFGTSPLTVTAIPTIHAKPRSFPPRHQTFFRLACRAKVGLPDETCNAYVAEASETCDAEAMCMNCMVQV